MKYLDPKADLTFKKIFGNHPKRLISLLNALLPLSEEEQIHEIKYLPTELVPQLEGGKNCLIREKVVTFRMVKLNMLLSIFLITK